jgi:hypothetical protein
MRIGFPGVFPQKPGQDEDQMTHSNVKTGYIDKGIIQVNILSLVMPSLKTGGSVFLHVINASLQFTLERNSIGSRNPGR